MVSEPLPRSNSPENAGACSNTASLFDGISTVTPGFVLVADPSEDVAPKNFGAGWMPAAAASRRDARSPALSSGARSRSLQGAPTPDARRESDAEGKN